MTHMRAVDAIVQILEKEGATQAFGVPGAAINPLYSAMKEHGGIRHVLARHVEAAKRHKPSRSWPVAFNICQRSWSITSCWTNKCCLILPAFMWMSSAR